MDEKHTSAGAALNELVLEIFRLNGRLLAAGDELVADIGLTSARWQILGAIHLAQIPQTVSQIARSMGLSRQAVQRLVNELEHQAFLAFKDNPSHRRAQLVTLTRKGRAAYAAASRRQTPWVNGLAHDLDARSIARARDLLSVLRRRIEASESGA